MAYPESLFTREGRSMGAHPSGPRARRAGRILLVGAILGVGILHAGASLPQGSGALRSPLPEPVDSRLPANPLAGAELTSSTGQCGTERWSVKIGTDQDSALVNLNSTTVNTVASMDSYAEPSSLPSNNRVQPQETTQYSIDATLSEYKLETDSDYHLVLRDGSGNSMIAEIPDPNCLSGVSSPFTAGIRNARDQFDAFYYNVNTNFQVANVPVRVTGIGFFDHLHGQTGVAPNGIELHPVLDVQFNPGSPSPSPAGSPTPSAAGSPNPSPTTSSPSGPVASGWVLDDHGALHAYGAAPAAASATWGTDQARGMARIPDHPSEGYTVDANGNLHPFGGAPPVQQQDSFTFDIARGVSVNPTAYAGFVTGYVLDGYGGVHPFVETGHQWAAGQTFPTLHLQDYWGASNPYHANWDIAVGVAAVANTLGGYQGSGFVLDGYGGVHPFWVVGMGASSPPPATAMSDYWGSPVNFAIARGIALNPVSDLGLGGPCVSGYTLDGYGGVHPFRGSSNCYTSWPAMHLSDYWGASNPSHPNWDIARGVATVGGNYGEGLVVDAYGGVHPFSEGSAPSPAQVSTAGYPFDGSYNFARGIS
ncbi:MAG: hypothetical protein ACYDAY_06215 [Candidatus Dormibacteria bacterium]